MKKLITILLFVISITCIIAQQQTVSREIPYTQDDRDRMIRLEERLASNTSSLQKQIDQRFESLQKQMDQRFDDIRAFMFWGFGILFASTISMVGFVLWDRRSVITPVKREVDELREENARIKKLIKDLAPLNEELMKAAKRLGLF